MWDQVQSSAIMAIILLNGKITSVKIFENTVLLADYEFEVHIS